MLSIHTGLPSFCMEHFFFLTTHVQQTHGVVVCLALRTVHKTPWYKIPWTHLMRKKYKHECWSRCIWSSGLCLWKSITINISQVFHHHGILYSLFILAAILCQKAKHNIQKHITEKCDTLEKTPNPENFFSCLHKTAIKFIYCLSLIFQSIFIIFPDTHWLW